MVVPPHTAILNKYNRVEYFNYQKLFKTYSNLSGDPGSMETERDLASGRRRPSKVATALSIPEEGEKGEKEGERRRERRRERRS